MLVEFGFRNQACFREWQTLSMVAEEDKRGAYLASTNLFQAPPGLPKGMSLIRSALVFGPNGSGKSSLCKALQGLQMWITNPENSRMTWRFCFGQRFGGHAPSWTIEPAAFSVTFVQDSVRYRFEAEGADGQVTLERLTAYPKNHAQLWYERVWSSAERQFIWKFGSHLKGPNQDLSKRTPATAPFLGVAATWEHSQLRTVAAWFRRVNTLVSMATHFPTETDSLRSAVQRALSEVTEAKQGGPFLAFLRRLVTGADLGIVGLHPFPALGSEERQRVLATMQEQFQIPEEALGAGERLALGPAFLFLHKSQGPRQAFVLPEVAESDGTLRLLALSTQLYDALSGDGILVVDELDRSLHPALTQAILRLFQEKEHVAAGAQLIGTVHDVTLLDPTLLRRDQIWFTQKGNDGAASLFSLAEYKGVRKDDPFMRRYLSGVYGAIPDLDGFGVAP